MINTQKLLLVQNLIYTMPVDVFAFLCYNIIIERGIYIMEKEKVYCADCGKEITEEKIYYSDITGRPLCERCYDRDVQRIVADTFYRTHH